MSWVPAWYGSRLRLLLPRLRGPPGFTFCSSSALTEKGIIQAHKRAGRALRRAGVGGQDDEIHQDIMMFTVGLPGAGKTTVLHRNYGLENIILLDLDQEIKLHSEYDPENPAKVYANIEAYRWANAQVEKKFSELLENRAPLVALDGTGTKTRRHMHRMRRAREAGYFVRLIHVKVSLETAIRRQKKRHRQVPKEVMKRYQEKIDRALRFEIPLADEYLMVDNNKDDGLTDEQRWGTSIANDIVEQERVYDSIWMSIAEDAYRKSHRKAQEQGQNPDSDLSSLDIPPWLRREVSGFCDDPIYIPPHHVLIDAEKNEEERDEPFCP